MTKIGSRRKRQLMIEADKRRKQSDQWFPDHQTQTSMQMDDANLQLVENRSWLYSRDVDAGEKVSRVVDYIRATLAEAPPLVNWNDTEAVKKTLLCYLDSCSRVGTIPSKQGLALACGCNSQTMMTFIRKHPNHPSARVLGMALESFSEALAQSALNGSVQQIYAIFTQKASYGMRENEVTEPVKEDPLGDVDATESISRKYDDLVIDE